MSNNLLNQQGNGRAEVEQYFDTCRRSEHLAPEKMLLLAILQDAIHCYRKFSAAQDSAGRRRFREAQRWIMRADTEWIFGFAMVCELLGVDPQYIRCGLLARGGQTATLEKPTKREGLRRRAA